MQVTRDLTKLPGISINSVRKKSQPDANAENNEDSGTVKGPVTPFSREQFLASWNKLAQNIKAEGKDSLFITLTKREPVIDSDYKILLVIDNKTQEQSLERDKQNVLEFLRSELSNYALTLTTMIEEGESNAVYYTSKEKFRKLAEKNPHLLLLQKRLNLDIDF